MIRLAISAAAGIGAGVFVAVAVAIADLYLTGHGMGSLTGELIRWAPGGVYLSLGDVIMLAAIVAAACVTWYLLGREA
jgi:hypothetical protein